MPSCKWKCYPLLTLVIRPLPTWGWLVNTAQPTELVCRLSQVPSLSSLLAPRGGDGSQHTGKQLRKEVVLSAGSAAEGHVPVLNFINPQLTQWIYTSRLHKPLATRGRPSAGSHGLILRPPRRLARKSQAPRALLRSAEGALLPAARPFSRLLSHPHTPPYSKGTP